MVKTYIPTPNFSTAPPPDGPLKLGHVLKSLNPGDFLAPLNRKGTKAVVPVDAQDLMPVDIKVGWRASRKELLSGDFGIWAQLASVFGVGIEGGVEFERGTDDVLSVDRLETHTFISTEPYIRKTLDLPAVDIHIKTTGSPVYLITGMKVARGVSLESAKTRSNGLKVKLGFAHLGSPVEGGPETGAKKTVQDGLSFEGSSDFVIGVRVEKIRRGSAEGKLYTKGATMQDGNEVNVIEREDPGVEDVVPGYKIVPGGKADKEGEEDVVWVVPNF